MTIQTQIHAKTTHTDLSILGDLLAVSAGHTPLAGKLILAALDNVGSAYQHQGGIKEGHNLGRDFLSQLAIT